MNRKEDKSDIMTTSRDMVPETLTEKSVIALFDIDYTIFHTGRFKDSGLRDYTMYPGDFEAIEDLAGVADLGIFSQETPPINQIKKLDETGVRKYFPDERVHLYVDKLTEIERVLEKYKSRKKIVLVEDKLSVLRQVKSANPAVVAVWMNRGPYAQREPKIEGFEPDFEVKDLAGTVPIIQSLCAEFSERTSGARLLDRRGV